MCTALEELKREGVREGMLQGKIIGRYEDSMSPEEIARKMGLTVQQIEGGRKIFCVYGEKSSLIRTRYV